MNSKEVIQEIRTLLGFSEEKQEVKMETATLVDGTIIEWEGELAVLLKAVLLPKSLKLSKKLKLKLKLKNLRLLKVLILC